jgi:hypothetical protein
MNKEEKRRMANHCGSQNDVEEQTKHDLNLRILPCVLVTLDGGWIDE